MNHDHVYEGLTCGRRGFGMRSHDVSVIMSGLAAGSRYCFSSDPGGTASAAPLRLGVLLVRVGCMGSVFFLF